MDLSFSPALPAKLIAACAAAVALAPAPAAAQSPRPAPPPVAPQQLQPPSVEQILGRHDVREPKPDQFIVELDAEPVARYDGGVAGLAATSPDKTGRDINRDAPAVKAYEAHLDDRQASVLRAVPGVKPQVSYRMTFAGFAAKLTDDQAGALRKQAGVKRVTQERILHVTESQAAPAAPGIGGSEPELLGLPGGLWKKLGGPANARKGGVGGGVDPGIKPQSPPVADPGPGPPAAPGGGCPAGGEVP